LVEPIEVRGPRLIAVPWLVSIVLCPDRDLLDLTSGSGPTSPMIKR
jgi:hypothetical protein